MMFGPGGAESSDDPPTPPTPPTDPTARPAVIWPIDEPSLYPQDTKPASQYPNPLVPRSPHQGDEPTAPSSQQAATPLMRLREDRSTPQTHRGPRPTPATNAPRPKPRAPGEPPPGSLQALRSSDVPDDGPPAPKGLWARFLGWFGR